MTILEEMCADKKEERARKADMNEKKYLLEKEMLEIEKRKADLEELREEEKIMRMETSGMPSHLQEYYYHRQMEILEKKIKIECFAILLFYFPLNCCMFSCNFIINIIYLIY